MNLEVTGNGLLFGVCVGNRTLIFLPAVISNVHHARKISNDESLIGPVQHRIVVK